MKFWTSWYSPAAHGGYYELHSPWWVSGYALESNENDCGEEKLIEIVCAAIIAEDETDAKNQIYECYDKRPQNLAFRFIDQKPEDWSPFSGRFPRGDWMRWP